MLTNSLQVASAQRSAAPPNGSTDLAIWVQGLHKRYGEHDAVRGVDLRVAHGEIFAFLGPNGAGKTTTLEILEGFRDRTSGRVEVLGADPAHAGAEWRSRLGIVLQESAPEIGLTVRECLALYAGYYRSPRPVGETLELVELLDRANQRASTLSGGQRRRLDVALALIGDPELIFLDEPTTGFDPSARRAAWTVIDGLRTLGKTIVLTTHYMEEAERLADRIAVIAGGEIVAEGTPKTLGDRDRAAAEVSFTLPRGWTTEDLPAGLRPDAQATTSGRVSLSSTNVAVDVHELSGWALDLGVELDDLEVRRPTLEDVYLGLTDQYEHGSVHS
jgi:ABC-2 type transport system ATP-binding protein